MRQGLGEGLHAGLGDVVGGIAWWRGDALLGSGVDDEPRLAALDHVWGKGLRAVNDAPQIDREDALPVVVRAEHLAAGLDTGIVHQDIGAAEAFAYSSFEFPHTCGIADISCHRHDAGGAAGRR